MPTCSDWSALGHRALRTRIQLDRLGTEFPACQILPMSLKNGLSCYSVYAAAVVHVSQVSFCDHMRPSPLPVIGTKCALACSLLHVVCGGFPPKPFFISKHCSKSLGVLYCNGHVPDILNWSCRVACGSHFVHDITVIPVGMMSQPSGDPATKKKRNDMDASCGGCGT